VAPDGEESGARNTPEMIKEFNEKDGLT